MPFFKKRGFTLAEVMITLTIIGIITAVIIPVAINSKPDENIMKFKKAHNTLWQAISELVNSDKYYLDGDLGKKTDGNWVVETDYFCNSFADVISTKEAKCTPNLNINLRGYWAEDWQAKFGEANIKEGFDTQCSDKLAGSKSFIISSDNVTFFEANPSQYPFGIAGTYNEKTSALSADNFQCWNRNCYYFTWDHVGFEDEVNYRTANSFLYIYKIFCIDVDGIGKGEEPFGYGIRVDGKIMAGKRATEWLEKSIQGE